MSVKKALSDGSVNYPVAVDEEESADFWQRHIDSWVRSGISQAAYCRKHELDYNRFRKWKERLSAYPSAKTSIKLVEVKRDFTLNDGTVSATGSSTFPGGQNNFPRNVGIGGMKRGETGGFSGIRFWCREFCVELDAKFSSDCLQQLIRTLQGLYIQSDEIQGPDSSESPKTSKPE